MGFNHITTVMFQDGQHMEEHQSRHVFRLQCLIFGWNLRPDQNVVVLFDSKSKSNPANIIGVEFTYPVCQKYQEVECHKAALALLAELTYGDDKQQLVTVTSTVVCY